MCEQRHTAAECIEDSEDSESPTLETCLDETDAENSTSYRLVCVCRCVPCLLLQWPDDEHSQNSLSIICFLYYIGSRMCNFIVAPNIQL